MRMVSLRTDALALSDIACPSVRVIERDGEHIERAQAMARREPDLAVGDHRHALLGKPTMRAQRYGQTREIMLGGRRAERLVPRREGDDVAETIGRQLERPARLGACQRSFDDGSIPELG